MDWSEMMTERRPDRTYSYIPVGIVIMLSGDISLGATFFRSLGIRDGALSFVVFVSVYICNVCM